MEFGAMQKMGKNRYPESLASQPIPSGLESVAGSFIESPK